VNTVMNLRVPQKEGNLTFSAGVFHKMDKRKEIIFCNCNKRTPRPQWNAYLQGEHFESKCPALLYTSSFLFVFA
jgi:hypothetical protein